ncbi:hypothetical protein LC612_23080 [Nostoc sp. CHAB 5834]|nr:hypothetical protein [Nostoc sp. CHAB 5834]
MRPKLLKSFLLVLTFWFIATALWWSLQKPEVNLQALSALKDLLPFLPFEVPAQANILQSIMVQKDVLFYWTIPMLVGTVLSGAVGYGLIWLKAHGSAKERTARETGSGNFRGVTLTVGELPVPNTLPRDEIELDSTDESLRRVTERERVVLEQVLGTLSAHPDAYPGDGISGSLFDHALLIVEKALQSPRNPGLLSVVAAASELGKISAYKKDEAGTWSLAKNKDRESAKILGTLSAWHELPNQERNAVMMAVKFHSTPKMMPEFESDPVAYRMARELLYVSEETQATVVVEEKAKTLEMNSGELPDVIFSAFIQSLPSLSFQNKGLPKGVQAVAWKVGMRVYLLEIKLRETVSAKLPNEIRGALTSNPKDRSKLQPFSTELLKALDAKGWLVKAIDGVKLDGKEALWNVKAGKLEFKGVIIIDVPEDFRAQLPSDDSMYGIAVTGPLFTPLGGGMNISKSDLLGSVLRPQEKPPAESV